ncbi:MAG: hypothetical protein R2828_29725 [Saprospiraceae bacterium]
MPIDYKTYHPKWKKISAFIRYHRARNKCERCGAPNEMVIIRNESGWTIAADECQQWNWEKIKASNSAGDLEHFTKVVLAVAHLDRNKHNNRFWNLAALCQSCHLRHDRSQHVRNRKYGRHHKERQIEIPF